MSLKLPEKGGSFELTPAGSHLAICYRFIDLGTQPSNYNGVPSMKHKVMISWELPEEKMADGRPFSVHETFNFSSSNKSTFRKTLEAWRGVAFTDQDFGTFDMSNLIGKSAMVGIVHTKKGEDVYSNMNSIMRIPKGIAVPTLTNETIYLSLDEDFKDELYSKLSDNLRMKISDSPEYKKLKGTYTSAQEHTESVSNINDLDDEIPF